MGPVQLSLLDVSFADFIVRITDNPSEYLWISAAMTSAITAQGHVCLDLGMAAGCEVKSAGPDDGLYQLPPAVILQQSLAGCNSVGRPGDFTPLVLDADGRLYLHRSWDAERRVVEGIRSHCISYNADQAVASSCLNRFFPDEGCGEDLQRKAAEAALHSGFTVVSGGPGTGKTTTVARILALLVEVAGVEPDRISLAAPTGKAAMRLKQSLAAVFRQLPLTEDIRAALPREVTTVHRLLGLGSGRNGRYNRDNPLPCQVLVVDEASMVDLSLMASILEALSPGARVILLGDRDQLASVEAGAVLADICAGSEEGGAAAGERPAIIQLTKSYRFDSSSGIGELSRLINAGDGDGAVELLLSDQYTDVCWRQLPDGGSFPEAIAVAARDGFADFTVARSPDEALQALDSFRILTPHREGGHGVTSLNRYLESVLGQQRGGGSHLSQLRPVMIRENNYELGLFNGDTGVVLDEGEANPVVYFFSDSGAGNRRLSSLRLPPHETAYALTVHKSQGSEYDSVLLVLPDRLSDVMNRELLYTAVTRAKKRVEIWGTTDVIRGVAGRCTVRNSGLQDLLRMRKAP